MKNDKAIGLLNKGDYVMHFDPEYDIWFKCQILKTTENFYVVGLLSPSTLRGELDAARNSRMG